MSGVRIVQGSNVSNDQELIMANSATIDFQDPVTIDTNGFLNRITSSSTVAGFFEAQTTTVLSNNQTVALTKGQYDGNLDEVVVEMSTLSAVALTQTNIGDYFNVDVTSNVITINTGTFGTTGQFELIDIDPNRDGTTTLGRARVALPQKLSFAPHA